MFPEGAWSLLQHISPRAETIIKYVDVWNPLVDVYLLLLREAAEGRIHSEQPDKQQRSNW